MLLARHHQLYQFGPHVSLICSGKIGIFRLFDCLAVWTFDHSFRVKLLEIHVALSLGA